jgi:hypothetical protein
MSEPVRDDVGMSDEPASSIEDASPGSGSALPPPTSVESLVSALLDAGPEVAEHVVRAAQELLLAATVIVDAAEKAIQEQQDVRAARDGSDEHDAGAAADAGTDASVHRLDLAE